MASLTPNGSSGLQQSPPKAASKRAVYKRIRAFLEVGISFLFFFAQKGAPKNAGTQCSGSGGNTVLGRCEHTDGATELLLKQEGVEVVGEVHRGGQIAVEVREVHIHGPLVEEACRGGGEGRLTDTGMHKILTNISTPPFGEKSCFGLLLPGD